MTEYCDEFSSVKKTPPLAFIEKLLEQKKFIIEEFVKSRNKPKNVTSFVEMLESQINKEINAT